MNFSNELGNQNDGLPSLCSEISQKSLTTLSCDAHKNIVFVQVVWF